MTEQAVVKTLTSIPLEKLVGVAKFRRSFGNSNETYLLVGVSRSSNENQDSEEPIAILGSGVRVPLSELVKNYTSYQVTIRKCQLI